MEKDELLVRELSELIGVELSYSDDRTCDLAVDGRIVALRYRPDDDDWLYFGVVSETEDDQSREVLAKALKLNLFGSETLGMHLGLFGNALVLSGSVPMDGLTAENFAERLLFLSRHIGKLAEKLEVGSGSDDMRSSEEIPSPWGAGFMQV
ncbi:MAG: type III secretion system chaperone [Kiritimatiellae bacterium]|nr:type III secretion system chaperone [Kiritimatiellia bacterium]